jgi:hypothetical protein
MVEASAAVLEASTTASRANSLGKTDPDRMGRADKARRKLTSKAVGITRIRQLPRLSLRIELENMSLAEIKSAVDQLSPRELAELATFIRDCRFGLP